MDDFLEERSHAMKSKTPQFWLTVILMALVFGLTACGVGEPDISTEERVQTRIAETMAVEYYVQTGVAERLAASSPFEEGQAGPEASELPVAVVLEVPATTTVTALIEVNTATPSIPMVTVSRGTNCRSGPGTEYKILGELLVGQQAEVVGVFPDWDYWIIKNPDKTGECWLWGEYASVSGETADLPRFTPPPTPTPEINWSGVWTMKIGLTENSAQSVVFYLTQTGLSISGASTGSYALSINGTLSADMLTVTGTWSSSLHTEPILWQIINSNQFVGNSAGSQGTLMWCGSRAGASFPSPCLGP
jgi:hypothetical protein